MKILLSNDDGIHAVGLQAIYKELCRIGDVWVVAPLEEKSTTGHSLTIHKPLRMIPMAPRFFGVSGSPADCVYVGVREVLKSKPDLVVSGINRGATLGQDVYYSGTVSAAREASMIGIPSFAVSLAVNFRAGIPENRLNYPCAAKLAVRLIRQLSTVQIPEHTLINVNVPDIPLKRIKGVKVCRMGFRYYSGKILKRRDHRGKDYYWVGGQYQGFRDHPDEDCVAVAKGYVSVTPLQLDCTHEKFMKTLQPQLK